MTDQCRSSSPKLLANYTNKFWTYLDLQLFDRFFFDSTFANCHNLRTTDLKFKTLASHCLNQNTQVQLSTTRHLKSNSLLFNPKRNICFKLFFETIADLTTSCKLALLALKRTRIRAKIHAQCWRLNCYGRQSFWSVFIGNCITNMSVCDTCQCNNIASYRTIDLFTHKTTICKNLIDTRRTYSPILYKRHSLRAPSLTPGYPTNRILTQK